MQIKKSISQLVIKAKSYYIIFDLVFIWISHYCAVELCLIIEFNGVKVIYKCVTIGENNKPQGFC